VPRSPEEILKEIAAWPIEERLRLAAKILETGAAEIERLKMRAGRPAPAPAAPPGAASQRPATPSPAPASPPQPTIGPRAAPPSAAPTSTAIRSLVVVDGSNFLGTVAGFDLVADASRDELVMRLQEFARDHPALRVVVYFDGQKTTVKRAGGVEVRFTSGEKPADFFILEALRALSEKERPHALLVTADRALADAARKLGAKVEIPSSFHRRLPGVKRTAIGERGLSSAEVSAWEDYFQKPPEPGKGPRRR
jgi:predicted RNA-binding protein with PIN domain